MPSNKKKTLLIASLGFLIGMSVVIGISKVYSATSTNESCMSCHVHPEADKNWKLSVHHNSKSGVVTNCVDCHLPPKGTPKHFFAKTKIGIKDIWAYMVKDSADFDWESKRQLEHAVKIVYNESCEKCHPQLFPARITSEGVTAHLYYEENRDKLNLQCISCHLDVGHHNPNYSHSRMVGIPTVEAKGEKFTEAAVVASFENFTERIPGTTVSFDMKVIPAGEFTIGSPESERLRRDDESPQKRVKISRFFMGETEVTWDMYWAFYAETQSEGRTLPETVYANNSNPDVDAISGPTPPFGVPDQGWDGGQRPAITMTYYGAETFCQWLSKKTGKKYRLPTEAEWEYAARGGTETPYFFPGNPSSFSNEGFWRRFIKADTTVINSYVIFVNNSKNRTEEPSRVRPNPFGLKHTLGNVMEYCSDWYAEDAYGKLTDGAIDPRGPESGEERVVRGGWFGVDASQVRSASRSHTMHDEWMKTDPQQPKSIWWYSDVKAIGFRVVCEFDEVP